jgi:hypothetical protein
MIPLRGDLADLANEYDVDYSRLLGCGGFGDVYAATDRHGKRPVAIKLIRKEKLKLWIEANLITFE